MTIESLRQPVTLAQAAVPIQICYIVPMDSDPQVLTAIFEESYSRWGGRDSLIVPMEAKGVIDEVYWAWAKSLDPDVVYSYADLDIPTLERIERDWMPSNVRIHRDANDPRVRHDHNVEGLSALSLLPMIAAGRRVGPPRDKVLVSAFRDWNRDLFVTDSFGINPQGPGWAGYVLVREHIAIMAVGSATQQMYGDEAEVPVDDTTSLLQLMASNQYEIYTMAQLSGIGYDHVHYPHASVWRFFNIIVGDANLDRIAFWNSRVGAEGFMRSNITAVRVPEERLDDPVFIEQFIAFIWRFNHWQTGQPFALIASSSVAEDRLQSLVAALAPRNVMAQVTTFTDANACRFDPRQRNALISGRSEQRFTETKAPLVPVQPNHMRNYGPIAQWLTQGSWVIDVAIKRETEKIFGSSIPPMPIPRRIQALRAITHTQDAKVTLEGNLRLVVAEAQAPQVLTFVDDDTEFIQQMLSPSLAHYTTTTDVRGRRLPKPTMFHSRPSSAGRHLAGLLGRMGSLRAAADVFENAMWQPILNELSLPREAFNEDRRADLIATLKKRFSGKGQPTISGDADFERLADVVARVAPGLKMPPAMRPFDYFIKMFERTDEAKRIREDAPPADVDQYIRNATEREVRYRRDEGILVQGYEWTCRRCDHPNWKTIKALEEIVACEVCELQHDIYADFEWSFILDGYVTRGIRDHGLRGVIWALGIMRWWGRYSFIFAPQLELVTSEGGKEKVRGDLDIACVIDGKLHIGEVKESRYDIQGDLGDKLVELALLVRPDVVVLACPDFEATSRVHKQTARIAAKVGHLNIKVMPLLPPDPARETSANVRIVPSSSEVSPVDAPERLDQEPQ